MAPRKHGVSNAGASGALAGEIEKVITTIPNLPARVRKHEQDLQRVAHQEVLRKTGGRQ